MEGGGATVSGIDLHVKCRCIEIIIGLQGQNIRRILGQQSQNINEVALYARGGVRRRGLLYQGSRCSIDNDRSILAANT